MARLMTRSFSVKIRRSDIRLALALLLLAAMVGHTFARPLPPLGFGRVIVSGRGPNVGQVSPPGTIAYIPCGASINAFTASVANGGNGVYGSGSGVVFQLAGSRDKPCTYTGQATIHTQSG